MREWVIEFKSLFQTSDIEVHVIHISFVIITYTLDIGHVQCAMACIKTVTDLPLPSPRRRGRPKKTWSKCVKTDVSECGLAGIDPQDRDIWRASVWHSLMQIYVTPVWSSEAIWHHRSWSILIQLMAYHLLGAKPLPEPLLIFHWVHSKEKNHQWNFHQNAVIFNSFNGVHLKIMLCLLNFSYFCCFVQI